MGNTRVFNDKNITKLNGFLEYLFKQDQKYTISVREEKDEFIFVVKF
jgi:hypothetical protein